LRSSSADHPGAQTERETAVVPEAKEQLFASVTMLGVTKTFLLHAQTLATADAQVDRTDVVLVKSLL